MNDLIWRNGVHYHIFLIIVVLFGIYDSSFRAAAEDAVEIYEFNVPRYPKAGDDVVLQCKFRLIGPRHKLYTVNWWRGKDQFFSYKATYSEPKLSFPFPGINVNVENSSADRVLLMKVSEKSSGLYRCEVMGEYPAFKTTLSKNRMTVIVPPEKLEITQEISRGSNTYDIGDLVKLNCTAYRVKPRPELEWRVNGKTVVKTEVRRFPDIEDDSSRISATTELRFLAAQHFINKRAVVTCTANVEGHQFNVEEHLRLVSFSPSMHSDHIEKWIIQILLGYLINHNLTRLL